MLVKNQKGRDDKGEKIIFGIMVFRISQLAARLCWGRFDREKGVFLFQLQASAMGSLVK